MTTAVQVSPQEQLLILSRSYVIARALHVAANLKIANYIDHQPICYTVLAAFTQTQPLALLRFLRFLTAYGIFAESEPDTFIATPLSRVLRDDQPDSIASTLRIVDQAWWNAIGGLELALKSNISAFEQLNGEKFFSYLAKDPERQQRFDAGMASLSRRDESVIAQTCVLFPNAKVLDVGGGEGGFLRELSKYHPNIQPILFEQPQIIAKVTHQLREQGLLAWQCISGDFFQSLPINMDYYIYKGVLHDFNDELVLKILMNTALAMQPTSHLLVIEQVIPAIAKPHPNKTMDIVMMALLHGRQRTLSEWQIILNQAGFTVKHVRPTTSIFTVIECQLIT